MALQPGSKLLFEEQWEDVHDSVYFQQLIFASEGWEFGDGRGRGLREGKDKGQRWGVHHLLGVNTISQHGS